MSKQDKDEVDRRYDEMVDISNALMRWFQSQDVAPADSVNAMNFLSGRIIAENLYGRKDRDEYKATTIGLMIASLNAIIEQTFQERAFKKH